MRRFEHGGDVYTHTGVVDFSANLNPLGMPQAALDALRENVGRFEAYPDPRCTELTRAIARMHELDERYLVCTAGATDLMDRIARVSHAKYALVAAPCYSGYEQALDQSGTKILRHLLREDSDFSLEDDFLDSMTGDISLIFIANPNNPTGLAIEMPLLELILDRAAHINARVVLDECFIEFSDIPSMLARIEEFPQLIIMRAFTKTYAMAGLRLGYGVCSDAEFMRALHDAGQPWAVSSPAQIAGVAACGQGEYVQKSRRYVCHERQWLKHELEKLGAYVIDGRANYLMFRCMRELFDLLLERGVLIRSCDNFVGLGDSWYRVAVRTHEENKQLIGAMKDVLL